MSNSLHKRLDKLERNRKPLKKQYIRPFRAANIYADGVGFYLIHKNEYYFFNSVEEYQEYKSEFYPQKGAITECRMYPYDRKASPEEKVNIVLGWDVDGNLSIKH